jgi:hypothetical protein
MTSSLDALNRIDSNEVIKSDQLPVTEAIIVVMNSGTMAVEFSG